MKAQGEKVANDGANAWGQHTTGFRQTFVIEASDVGQERLHRGGFMHERHTFTSSDVGRSITVYTDHTSWTCWNFS